MYKLPDECCKLQEDLNRLEDWSKAWLLKFNKSKCKHVQFRKPVSSEYYMENVIIKKESEEKDLGIIIDDKSKFKIILINKQMLKANRMRGLIKRTFKHLDSDMLLRLYKSLVRPQSIALQYGRFYLKRKPPKLRKYNEKQLKWLKI